MLDFLAFDFIGVEILGLLRYGISFISFWESNVIGLDWKAQDTGLCLLTTTMV